MVLAVEQMPLPELPSAPWAISSPLHGVGLRADGALMSSALGSPFHFMADFITAAVQWPHGFNDFSIMLSIPFLLIALDDWFLALILNYGTFFFFPQQTALCCIMSRYLPSGPITVTSWELLNKRHFSSKFIMPPVPVFSMDPEHIIISWGILHIDPSRCWDILQKYPRRV